MKKTILGISAFYHDSAAALVIDGNVVAAAQEERFTRKKHDPGFPEHAIAYCLREAGLRPDQLDYVAFYDKPLLKFERLLETYFAFAPSGLLPGQHDRPGGRSRPGQLPQPVARGTERVPRLEPPRPASTQLGRQRPRQLRVAGVRRRSVLQHTGTAGY